MLSLKFELGVSLCRFLCPTREANGPCAEAEKQMGSFQDAVVSLFMLLTLEGYEDVIAPFTALQPATMSFFVIFIISTLYT